MNRKSLLAFLIVILSLATAASRTQKKFTLSAPVSAVEIPFELVSRHIVVKVSINNSRPLSFVFDTGDQVAIVDTERAKELGLKLEGQIRVGGAGSDFLMGSFVRESNWTLPGLEGFSQPVTLAMPLGRMAARFGHDFDGIIGSDFIKQFVVEIDYAKRLLRLHDKEKFIYSGPGESVPIQLDGLGYPSLDGEVTPFGGKPIQGKFVLDIGSGGGLGLHSPFVVEHKFLTSELKTIRAIGLAGAGGQTVGRIGRVSELKIGKFRIANPIVLFSEDKAGAFANKHLAGNIGQRVASKFRLFLDYKRERIIFEPQANFSKPSERAFSGLAFTSEDKNYTTFRITDVLENSPAADVGLQMDDLIIKVDDKPASELTITKLSEMFEQPRPYKLVIRRSDKNLKVTLTPRKLV